MVRIGIVGLGYMGYTHFTAAAKLRGGKVTAISTRDPKKRAGDWSGISGNLGPSPSEPVDLAKVTVHEDWRDLIADPHVDLVDVCLPTPLHEPVAVAAAGAGKHVLVEKPLAPDAAAAGRMVAAAESAGTLLMTAHVLPFFPEFRYLHEAVTKKKYGPLHALHLRRVIATPPGMTQKMLADAGGWGADLHVHDDHLVCLLCGVPKAVFARGLVRDGLLDHVHSQYVFGGAGGGDGGGPAVSCVSGGVAAKGHEFGHGFEAYFEKATLLFSAVNLGGEFTADRPLTVLSADGKVRQPSLKGGEEWFTPFAAELQAAVKGVKEGKAPAVLSGTLAADALRVVAAEAEAVRSGSLTAVPGPAR